MKRLTMPLHLVNGPLRWRYEKTDTCYTLAKESAGHTFLIKNEPYRGTIGAHLKCLVEGNWFDYGWYQTIGQAQRHAEKMVRPC